MAKGIGRLLQIGIARETTRGTPPASATFWIPFSELDIDEKDARVTDEQSRGVIEASVGESIVKQWAEAAIKAPIGDIHFPLILYALCGTLTTTDNPDANPVVKDHTLAVQQGAQHQSLALYTDDPLAAQDYSHALAVPTSLEIVYEQAKFLEYSAAFRAKKGATATNTPAATSENRFLPQHLTFKTAATQAGLGAAAATIIKSLALRFNPNIEDDDVLGNIAPVDFLNKQFMVEGELEAIWQNESDFKTNALAGTVRAMRLDLLNNNVVIGTAANPELKIDLHSVFFKELTRPVRINDIVKQTLQFTAHYNTTDAKLLTIIATNIQASY